jgi:hypothetical protein
MALKLPRDKHFGKLLEELPKMESKLSKGQKIIVYRDPMTKKNVEGTALLRAFTDIVNDPLEWWLVRFENGEETFRWIDPS